MLKGSGSRAGSEPFGVSGGCMETVDLSGWLRVLEEQARRIAAATRTVYVVGGGRVEEPRPDWTRRYSAGFAGDRG